MRWIWVDRFVELRSGKSARAVKAISLAEDHLHDLYPGFPIMPHSLVIEGLAQTGGILVGEANEFREKVILAKIPRVRFEGFAVPGDLLTYEATLTELRPEGAIVAARAWRNDEPFAEAEIVFAHLDQSRGGDAQDQENFVFTRQQLLAVLKQGGGEYFPAEPVPATTPASV